MARLSSLSIAILLSSVPATSLAAQAANPWHASDEPAPANSFDLPDERSARIGSSSGSRIIAGTDVMPNATVGFGMFGHKSEKSQLAPATARDLSLPRTRRAAVGFSLKF